jgi:predicted RNA-binding protein with PIN domain
MNPLAARILLLVDGYNIIGAWQSLKKARDHHGLETARQHLVETLIGYTAYQGFNTQIVFDSQYQNTPGQQESQTPDLSVYYTAFAETADTYIERFCASFQRHQSSKPSRLIVATSDRAQQLTVVGYGAEWFSAQRLENEVESASHRVRTKHRSKQKTRGSFLANSLDPKTQEVLAQWRHGIK